MKTTTIHLRLVEDIIGDYAEVSAPRSGVNAGIFTPTRQALAERFGFDRSRSPKPIPAAEEGGTSCDLQKLAERIERIAERNGATVKHPSPTHWIVSRKETPIRSVYEFPTGSFAGCDQTKWGPTDFYDEVKAAILAALRSGLDFETPWLSCKKEILSSQISRSKGKVTVQVSVSDDFDTSGMGDASARIQTHARVSDETILRSLENLGAKAHTLADSDRSDNADYVGYSVGPDEKPYPWVMTYLVNCGGHDTPSGDNYHWWGWQEVETDDDDNPEPRPSEDQIPADVADKLAEMMENGISPAVYGGFRATAWKS